MTEEWKNIVGYERHYKISSLGRIKRTNGGRGATIGRVLKVKQPTRHCDYRRVQLSRNDTKRTFSVHVLVAEAFHGPRPQDKCVNHIDMNKLNNAALNLEWVTAAENVHHATKNGTRTFRPLKGSLNGRAKLTEEQVREIREHKGSTGQRVLAAQYGVSRSAIQFIHQGKHWKM